MRTITKTSDARFSQGDCFRVFAGKSGDEDSTIGGVVLFGGVAGVGPMRVGAVGVLAKSGLGSDTPIRVGLGPPSEIASLSIGDPVDDAGCPPIRCLRGSGGVTSMSTTNISSKVLFASVQFFDESGHNFE
jgi:hypothetical protein